MGKIISFVVLFLYVLNNLLNGHGLLSFVSIWRVTIRVIITQKKSYAKNQILFFYHYDVPYALINKRKIVIKIGSVLLIH